MPRTHIPASTSSRTQARAFSLLEIMLVLCALAAASLGMWRVWRYAVVKADTQSEQTSITALVRGVRGIYAAAPSYAGVSVAGLPAQGADLSDVLRTSTGAPRSAWGPALTIQSAQVRVPDDAFAVVLSSVSSTQCSATIPALALETAQVIVEGANIQPAIGHLPDGASIASACAAQAFRAGTGTLSFVYYEPRATGGAVAPPVPCAVSCAPRTETQKLPCPMGQIGFVEQSRNGTCPAAACPTLTWGPWTTTSSSCALAPVVPPPVAPPAPPVAPCWPHSTTRTQACAAGQSGAITQKQTTTCPGGVAAVGPWTTVSNTCVAPTPVSSCVPGTIPGADPCPAGQGGSITWIKNTTCAGGVATVGPKVVVGNTCTTQCALTGTCCAPSTKPGAPVAQKCAPGQYGQIDQTTQAWSTCASPTASPVWQPARVVSTSGTCAACPATSTQTTTQWIAQSAGCPAGQSGSHTWEQEQSATRTTSYDCASAPATLPAPTVSPWSAWADIAGATRGDTNTCAAGGGPGCAWSSGTLRIAAIAPTTSETGNSLSVSDATTAARSCAYTATLSAGGATQAVAASVGAVSNTSGCPMTYVAGVYCGTSTTSYTVGGVNVSVQLSTYSSLDPSNPGHWLDTCTATITNAATGRACRPKIGGGMTCGQPCAGNGGMAGYWDPNAPPAAGTHMRGACVMTMPVCEPGS